MSKEAMKLALEALEDSLGYVEEEAEKAQFLYGQYPTRQARIQGLKDDVRKHMKAITALQEALAEQPAHKRPQNCGTSYCSCIECVMEPAQYSDIVSDGGLDPRNTDPAQRTWVGLTDEEIDDHWITAMWNTEGTRLPIPEFARAIEAKLKEKNT